MRIYLKGWFWGAVLVSICVLCLAIYLIPKDTGDQVAIYRDGKLLYTFDQNEMMEDRVLDIRYEDGWNQVTISDGTIAVSDASCADGDCVNQGALVKGGPPIICLPNRLIINYTGGGQEIDVDAVSGGMG